MPLQGVQRGHQSAATPTPLSPAAAITTNKHLLHLQGRLREGFYSKSHTEQFTAFVMIGCVYYVVTI